MSIVSFEFFHFFFEGGFELTIVDRIFQLIEEEGITAKEFANKVGVSQGNITDWKTGRAKPSIESLQKISKYTKVDINWLIGYSYFKNNLEHSKALGFCSAILLNLSKQECLAIEDEVNRWLKPNSLHNSLISLKFPKIQSKTISRLLEILYHDYIENREMYQMLYGSYKFSIVDFMKYNALRFAKDNVKAEILAKVDELETKQQLGNIINANTKYYMCPVYGRISAGQPNWAEECIEGRIPIDPDLMNIADPEQCFFLRVNGESMNKEIKNGAYALIRKTDFVKNGEIAVVLVNGYDATLKKFSKQGDLVILEPMSDDPSYSTQVYGADTEIKILGKYIGKMEMK